LLKDYQEALDHAMILANLISEKGPIAIKAAK
jgi:hypothetical protein